MKATNTTATTWRKSIGNGVSTAGELRPPFISERRSADPMHDALDAEPNAVALHKITSPQTGTGPRSRW